MSTTGTLTASPEELDGFSASVARAYFPHDLAIRAQAAGPAELRAVDLGPIRLARIGWGSEVAVESDHPGAWAVNVPRSGVLEARVSGRHVLSLDGQATVCPPDQPTRMTRWSADCSIVGMRVERDYLADEVSALVGMHVDRLPAQLDLRTGGGRTWMALLTSIGAEALASPELAHDPRVSRRLAGTLSAAFVTACFPEEPVHGEIRPRIVSRVVAAMEEDPARDWTASDLARAAGIGIRRLQQGFRHYLGSTPTQELTAIRLSRVHADLLGGNADSVTEAAYRWGFTHLGRFAAAYKNRYGVTPSHTLRCT
ncbi:AraC family transcriptional regulator [Saccharopolyspora sp. TS4A08]|uniref:AraC family transcriptional regulator n=1 Tax=Saccharopolyspora ipomoeae TaxID=3042027 RepID=A0ABT6PV87_9PSEU|nr:AraC family transcriptional regulator [Saccharopolyspora sp. TS4A08]MDI2031922.1 AraC family transcriptional regulator [Saccharopolyspora sp. TS4A08]